MKKVIKKKPVKKKPVNPNKLTPKEIVFAQEYIIDKNGSRAAACAGYSVSAAKQQAHLLLKKKRVRDEVNRLLKKQSVRLEITADQVVTELAKLAFSDVRPLFGDDGLLKNINDLDNKVTAAISSVESLEEYDGHGDRRTIIGNTKKIRLWDKLRALEMLGRHLKMFTDVVEVNGGDFLQRMEAAKARLKKAQKK